MLKTAHKRVKSLPKDWRYTAARFGGINGGPEYAVVTKVGTYGIASAQFWWGRVAAIINRILISLGLVAWSFVYVDDILLLLNIGPTEDEWEVVGAVFLLLQILGFPVAWPKFRLGPSQEWTGHSIDLNS